MLKFYDWSKSSHLKLTNQAVAITNNDYQILRIANKMANFQSGLTAPF